MSGAKLKNFIILVLLVTIGFLLVLAVPQQIEIRRQADTTGQLLQSLCAQDGISLDPDILPTTQTLYELELNASPSAELAVATLLLGDGAAASEETGRQGVYTAPAGRCSFSAGDGGFSAVLTTPREAGTQLADYSRSLLTSLGYDPAEVTLAEPTGRTQRVTATQQYLGVPVFSSGLTLTYYDNSLTAVDGVFYIGDDQPVRISEDPCITCADAIVAFLAARDELGWVGEEITAVTQGYLRSGIAVNLTPAWRITTDTGVVEVNGITRAVSVVNE
jgi:hypothetical protein